MGFKIFGIQIGQEQITTAEEIKNKLLKIVSAAKADIERDFVNPAKKLIPERFWSEKGKRLTSPFERMKYSELKPLCVAFIATERNAHKNLSIHIAELQLLEKRIKKRDFNEKVRWVRQDLEAWTISLNDTYKTARELTITDSRDKMGAVVTDYLGDIPSRLVKRIIELQQKIERWFERLN